MYYQIFNRRVLECIGEFLQAKGVDLTEFRIQQDLILLRTTAMARSINPAAGSPGGPNIPPQSGPSGLEGLGNVGTGGGP